MTERKRDGRHRDARRPGGSAGQDGSGPVKSVRYDELSRSARRRLVAAALLRATASSALLLVAYYAAPLDRQLDAGTGIWFVLGLAFVAVLVIWDARAIAASAVPRMRAVQAVAIGLPALLVVFAATYVVIASNQPGSFTEELSRTDALYFTVTVFATVGFGDIAPRTDVARIVAMVQMLVGLIVVGLVAKILLGAVQVAVRRSEGGGGGAAGARDRAGDG